MEAYQERVVGEKVQLDEKIAKLREFFGTSTFGALPEKERRLMSLQHAAMLDYTVILGQRVTLFETTEKP
jgi:hypothetical protein